MYNNGGSSTIYAPVGQWTVQASFTEAARALTLGASAITLTPILGTVSIYYNALQTANDITGTGYSDGIKILQGTIVRGSGTFLNYTALLEEGLPPGAPNPFAPVDLDKFGSNDRPGILSVQGNGQSSLSIDIGASAGDFIDTNFFKSNITTMTIAKDGDGDASDTGQLVDPFTQANPSQSIMGYAPQYGGTAGNINGAIAANDGTNFTRNSDFHFQTTNVTSFTSVPEPGSLALVGLGFALTGALRRRKA